MGHADPVGGAKPQPAPKVVPFGKYLLLDRIAVGGMAEVYTAKSFGIEGFEKFIAIKRILPTMAEDDDFISMFIDEAKIAGHLTHANIVPIYELGKIGESHYIAMEYVWGKDLLQIMNRFRRMRRHMPPVMAAWIASKMLEGLDYAHRKRDRHGRPMGIIHRDVSPQNVLVSYEGQVKLIDFGIAKAASRNTKTQAGVLKGKFGYMSPEQVRGLPIDHRSDIFAVGTCLHEMLTGERLFVGESDFSTLEKVRNADVVPPSRSVQEMPPELEEIVLKALTREPDDRWQSAGEMQEELQRFIALSRPPFGTSKLNTWMRTAFAPEIAKEKGRLDSYNNVSHPGVPSAPQPRMPELGSTSPANPVAKQAPPPPPPPGAGIGDFGATDDDDDFGGGATMVTASPFDMMEEQQASGGGGGGGGGFEELTEEPTQIFFSADDLEEIEDSSSPPATSPAGSLSSPAPRMPAPVAVGTPSVQAQATPAPLPQPSRPLAQTMQLGAGQLPAAPQPTPQPAPSSPGGPPDMFAPPPSQPASQRNVHTMEVERPGQLKPPEKKSGMGKWIALLAVAALLVVGLTVGGALLFFGGEETGTVSVRVVPESAEARVFVDGVRRGDAPLLLEHVPEGEHTIEVRAEGFRTTSRTVPVNAGSTAMLEIAMEQDTPPPAVAAAPPTPTPTPEPVAAAEPEPEPEAEEPEPEPEPVAEEPEPEQRAEANVQPRQQPRQQPRRGGDTQRSGGTARSGGGSAAPRRAPAGRGSLTINTMPWARVFVDGRDTGRNTPVRNYPVAPGSHTIGLRTNDGTMHTVQVDVPAGENVRIVRQL
ncbi:MAG: protein kinase [Myxococcota bacterium]|nr:protein kinase [Myxococcota bacterium]